VAFQLLKLLGAHLNLQCWTASSSNAFEASHWRWCGQDCL